MKTWKWVAVGAAVLAVSVGGVALAVPAAGERIGAGLENRPVLKAIVGGLHQLRQTLQNLNLTSDQKQQIAGILKSHKAEIVAVVKDARAKHVALTNAVRADTINEAAIRAAAADLSKVISDGAVLHAKIRQEVRAVLTDDQKALVDKGLADVQKTVDNAIDQLAAN